MKNLIMYCFVGILMSLTAGNAFAALDQVDIAYVSTFTHGKVKTWSTDTPSGHSGRGGILTIDKIQSSGLGDLLDDPFYACCIELDQTAKKQTKTYAVSQCGDSLMKELWGRYFDIALVNKKKAEVFSACVWELTYGDSSLDVTSWDNGNKTGFKCTGLAGNIGGTSGANLANQWLGSLDGNGPMADLLYLRNGCYQDFVAQVPEPATISMLGLMSIGFLRKRK